MNTRILLLLFLYLFPSCPAIVNAQWEPTANPSSVATCFFSNDSLLFAGTWGGGIFRSNDKGADWTACNNGLNNPYINILGSLDTILYAGTYKGLFKSSDNGANWIPIIYANVFSFAFSGIHFFAGTDNGIYHTIDGGKSWVITMQWLAFSTFAFAGNNLYSGTSDGLYVTSDNGNNWDRAGLSGDEVSSLAVLDTNLYIGSIGTFNSGILRTNIDGTNWVQVTVGKKIPNNIYMFAVSGINLFAATTEGIFRSTDKGRNWINVSTGLLDAAHSLFVFAGNLYAATVHKGIWRRPLSEMITFSVSSSNQPSDFHLAQNYPNPFCGSTTMRFDLPERTFASLKVYDITGREVVVLANETLDAGSYTRNFNAEGMPIGTYVCRLEAGAFRQARTLQLLR